MVANSSLLWQFWCKSTWMQYIRWCCKLNVLVLLWSFDWVVCLLEECCQMEE
jgi:hypothetical protein